jgi:four helix bundle protein
MGVHDYRDFACWQLSEALNVEVIAFTSNSRVSRHFKYCDQIRDSASSAPKNIAEGFGRFRPAEFARFLAFARSSLMETQVALLEGFDSNYIDEKLYKRLHNLSKAALRATTNLMLRKQRDAAAARSAKPNAPSAKSPARSAKPEAPSAKPQPLSAQPSAQSAQPKALSAKPSAPSAKPP